MIVLHTNYPELILIVFKLYYCIENDISIRYELTIVISLARMIVSKAAYVLDIVIKKKMTDY